MSALPIFLDKDTILEAAPRFSSTKALAEHLGVALVTLYKNLHRLGLMGKLPLLPNRGSTGKPSWNKGLTKHDHQSIMSVSEGKIGAKNPRYGKDPWNKGLTKHEDERLALVAEKNTGRTPTVEVRKKMSRAAYRREGGGMTGKTHSDETKQKLREATIRQLKQGLIKQTETKPHIAVRKFLTNNIGVSFQEEVKIGIFTVDFLVGNIVIEVNGDYWHSNPNVYPEGPITKGQKVNRLRDIKKAKSIADAGLMLVVIWEEEVNNGTYADKLKQAINGIHRIDTISGTT